MQNTEFRWRGGIISDIDKWAADRNEQMVHYRARRQTCYGIEEYEARMPESFWQGLLMRAGWHYERIN